jgi:hypothetical protein
MCDGQATDSAHLRGPPHLTTDHWRNLTVLGPARGLGEYLPGRY